MRRKVSKVVGRALSKHKLRPHRSRRILVEELESRLTPSGSTAHFAVIGDFGQPGAGESSVATLVKSWNPDFIATVGDNVYEAPPQTFAKYDLDVGQYYHNYIYPYTGQYGAGATSINFYPDLGNHDWGDA